MNVVILVPWRPDNGHRSQLWAHCKPIWTERHGWSIFEGASPEGPFNRSAGINDAVLKAGADWDVALIIDSDVICDPRSIESAVEIAHSTDRLVVAHDERVMLNQHGTQQVLNGYSGSWRASNMVERIWSDSVSCAIAVSRKLWDAAGPFDEEFVGWGREDTAFRISCEAETGAMLRVSGETFHLWHPPQPETAQHNPLRIKNEERHQQYVAARWNRAKVRALRMQTELKETRIPRILHRTVPAETSEQVEAWWKQFEQLHPGWELRTYREPINPKEWPLTGDLFSKCATGAQKAGLIRLEALVTHGGVYVDSDCEPFRSLEPLLRCEAFAAWEDDKVIPDAVLGATKDHPAFKQAIEKARQSIESGGDAWASGPGVTTALFANNPDVLVLPPGSFYPMHYLDRQSREIVQSERPPWAFLMHHYHHSWGTDSQKQAIEAKQRQ